MKNSYSSLEKKYLYLPSISRFDKRSHNIYEMMQHAVS